jgi:hypothetical protein
VSRDTRFFLVVSFAIALMVAASKTDSGTFALIAWFVFPLAWLSQIKIADTHSRLLGPIWLRRTVYAGIAVAWAAIPMSAALS